MKKYWLGFIAVIVVSFIVLGWVGSRVYQQAPPIPSRVVLPSGETVIGEGEISAGQNVWQAMGGMELGSIWGHGSYVAPDWSADYLHRESMFILDEWSMTGYGSPYATLPAEFKATLQTRLAAMMRTNTFDASTGTITIEPVRAKAFTYLLGYYAELFSDGKPEYAIRRGTVTDPDRARKLVAFIFWSSWAASTNRPGEDVSYTSNWPHEDLVDNHPTGDAVVWTGVSIIVLLAGIGGMAFYYARQEHRVTAAIPVNDPLLGSQPTPSQKATAKYFFTVTGLILLQVAFGVITAHYGVEGDKLYGIPLSGILPYTITRTWHTQLGIFWIATAWLAAGLFIAPAVGGHEPKHQRLGVNVLFGALLFVVLGSMAGEWLSVMNRMPNAWWFLFGHSGYEYIDLGRFFQIALFIGLLLWLVLMVRALRPALKEKNDQKPILTLFVISSVAIAGFYAAALVYGKHTNLAIAEYWRWWVVHLWVEGFFEVFATVVIAFLFARLKLVSLGTASRSTVLASTIFLSGGIIGTLHHLYFSGTPTVVLALGAVFSALEVVPLMFVGFEAWHNYKLSHAEVWIRNYRWPIYFFISVAFWNMVGAGLFGFMINPPVALYYMQGLNTTPVHAHAALFGVYGMLGIGLMLFTFRTMNPGAAWNETPIRWAFWCMNIGIMAMVLFSLLPVGLMQTYASVQTGYWYARSAEFLQTGTMQTLRWLRVIGDTIFTIGTLSLAWFVVGLITGRNAKTMNNMPG